MSELNPDHPMSVEMRDRWHKLVALVMLKFKAKHVVITIDDLKDFPMDNYIVVNEDAEGLHLRLVDKDTAEFIALKQEGQVM